MAHQRPCACLAKGQPIVPLKCEIIRRSREAGPMLCGMAHAGPIVAGDSRQPHENAHVKRDGRAICAFPHTIPRSHRSRHTLRSLTPLAPALQQRGLFARFNAFCNGSVMGANTYISKM